MFECVVDPWVAVVALICVFVASFLLGSIPWGVILSRMFYKKDIRDVGSGNIGTTNAFRAMGKKGGVAVFLLDAAKGICAGLVGFFVGQWITGDYSNVPFGPPPPNHLAQLAGALSFCGCIWGHIFTPWLKFRGGKGIAVAFGCELIFFGWLGALIQLAVFVVVTLISRMVSLGSICGAIALPFIAAFMLRGDWVVVAMTCLIAITVIWAHRANIARIRNGEESRIGSRK